MWNIGFAELLVVAVVALVFLGPDQLPEAARMLGQVVRKVRGFYRQVTEVFDDDGR